jgi:N-acetylmuramoyl-L-alanine amidase
LAEGWGVAMTRTSDTQLSTNKVTDLELRAIFTGEQRADVFLSIHFDAAPSASVHGSEIFSYIPVGQRSTESWGTGRNDRHTEVQAGNRNDDWNVVLAHSLFRVMPRGMATFDHGERIRDLSVLRNAPCPAVLVEPAYLSNDSEAQRLRDPAFRDRIAATLAAGLRDYAAVIGTFQPAVPSFHAAPPPVLSRPTPPKP